MNYQRIYDEIIERAKPRGLDKKVLEGYFERHHIVPRCLNGTNIESNLVLLTAREHFICHQLLWKIHRTCALIFAFHNMIHCKRTDQQRYANRLTSKQYEIVRVENSKSRSKFIMSDKARASISIHNSSEGNPFYKKTHSDALKSKWSLERCGGGNPNAKGLIFQNLYFNSLTECADCYHSTRKIIWRKLISPKFLDCFRI